MNKYDTFRQDNSLQNTFNGIIADGNDDQLGFTFRKIKVWLNVGIVLIRGELTGFLGVTAVNFANPVTGIFKSLSKMPGHIS